jgi:hypothetical protein
MDERRDMRPQPDIEREREEGLPEHERRPEERTGGGLTRSGISAEQYAPPDEEVLEVEQDEEPAIDPDKPPPAYRGPTG